MGKVEGVDLVGVDGVGHGDDELLEVSAGEVNVETHLWVLFAGLLLTGLIGWLVAEVVA